MVPYFYMDLMPKNGCGGNLPRKFVKCYRMIQSIPSTSAILSENGYHCIKLWKHHDIRPVDFASLVFAKVGIFKLALQLEHASSRINNKLICANIVKSGLSEMKLGP